MFSPDVEGILLRSISSAGVLSLNEAKELVTNYNSEGETSDLKEIISNINDKIKPYSLLIKVVKKELTDEKVLVFLNLASNDATKAQNFFSAIELDYFRLLIEEIMTTEKRQITGIYAMNLVGRMKSAFLKSSAQKLLVTWTNMHYLEKIGNEYALGVRAIHEFESYLRQNLADTIEQCILCKQIVFRGGNCPSCASAIHTRCLTQYVQNIPKWPCCKIPYNPNSAEQSTQNCSSQMSITSQQNEESEVFGNDLLEEQENDEDEEGTSSIDREASQMSAPEISQSVARKRKRGVLE